MERQALYLNRCRNLQIIFKETYYSMPLPNDKNTSALQQLTFLDDLVASERRNISDVIFRRIRDAIISGELPPGYVFPNENELCKKLNIGRSSLREAYSPLETLKLISRSKAGTYVNDLDIYQNALGDQLADFTVNTVSVPNTELATVPVTKDTGMVYFFSMSTDFAKASLGAEGIKKYVPMLIGNGYYPGHAEIVFDAVRREEKLRDYFTKRYCK